MWRDMEACSMPAAAPLPVPRRTWTSCAGGLGPTACQPCSPSGPGSCCWPPRESPTPRSPSGSASLGQRSLPAATGMSAAGWVGWSTGRGLDGLRPCAGGAGPRSCRSPSTRPRPGWGSPTGRPGCWPASSVSAATPSPAYGASTASSPGAPRPLVLHRPRAGRQGPRPRRALPVPTRARGRPLGGREVPDPSPGTHPAHPPRVAGTPRAAHP
jgi:hypothetical protein